MKEDEDEQEFRFGSRIKGDLEDFNDGNPKPAAPKKENTMKEARDEFSEGRANFANDDNFFLQEVQKPAVLNKRVK